MKTVFAGTIKVLVLRNGKEIDRIVRPLRRTPAGSVVKYKRKLWRVENDSINVSGTPLSEDDQEGQKSPPTAAKESAPVGAELVIVDADGGETSTVVADFTSTDDGQRLVVGSNAEGRLLVDAGPGTGKTHTACLKVASLIAHDDIPPSRIWLISFTRTAVHEIRNRLTALLENAANASSVRIATLDSLAWTIHSGFSNDAVLTGSYDDNITQTLAKIRTSPEVGEELEKVRHVVIDEAQDIVGVRAELVLAIIDAVASDCGVTVFADQAQAIYGFTEDETADEGSSLHLVPELEDRKFKPIALTEIHRTDSPALLRIFKDVRRKVLDTTTPALARGAEIRTEIEQLADAALGHPGKLKLSTLSSGSLVLMRQRSEVLVASSFNQETTHRLRMSGLPIRILPWVSLLFWDHVERRLTRENFEKLWLERTPEKSGAPPFDTAWQQLYQAAGESASVIDLHKLRYVLGRSNPPSMFTSPEYGDAGPIIGTIHASKGREADEVLLYLPPLPEQDDEHTDADEEVRVMFVGATRARKKLSVGSSSGRRLGNLDGRFWKRLPPNRIQVEIGRARDIDERGLVGTSTFDSAESALHAQQHLLRTPVMTDIFASQAKELGWRFALATAEKVRLGALSEKVNRDLAGIAKKCESWPPPNYLPHIRSIGLRSIILRADDNVVDQLHEPWRSSGFMFAPMLLGMCLTKFRE